MTDAERIFNYRLSRGRRVVENAFGILGNIFQCLLSPFRQVPKSAQTITLSCVCLHNLMRLRYPSLQNAVLDQEDGQHGVVAGAWRNGLDIQLVDDNVRGNRATNAAKLQREYLKEYINSPAGAVPWQNNMI